MSDSNDAFELPAPVAGWLNEYLRLKAEVKDIMERLEIARAHVESAMGDKTIATINNVPVLKWDYVESRRMDQKKVQEILTKDALEAVFTTTRSRVFRPISQDEM